jgi:ribosomal protein S8
MEIYLHKIAEAAGLRDTNKANLKQTVENNILEPLKNHGYIETYEEAQGLDGTTKYMIIRNSEVDAGVKDAGSVKKGCRVGKK